MRRFTLQALDSCDLLTLSVSDLDKLRIEFPDVYEELFNDANARINRELKMKKTQIKACIKEENQLDVRFGNLFMQGVSSESSDEDVHNPKPEQIKQS